MSVLCVCFDNIHAVLFTGNKVDQVITLITRGVFDDHTCQILAGRPTTHICLESPVSTQHTQRATISHGRAFEEPKNYVSKMQGIFTPP